MERKLDYSFDDEPVSKFCCDLDNQKIEMHFKSYHNLVKDAYMSVTCAWSVKNWKYAHIKIGDDEKEYDLNKYLSIISFSRVV